MQLIYPKPNEIVQASAIPWRVIAVAWTPTNKNTDVRFLLNGVVVGTDISAIQTIEDGVKKFNYQWSVPLKVAGDYTITAEEIDTKAQTVRSSASVNFSVIVTAGAPVSTAPGATAGDSLWKLDNADRVIPKKADRTAKVKRLETGELSIQNPEWKIKLAIDEERWLTTTDESAAAGRANLKLNNLQLSGALLFEDFSLIGSPIPKQQHWDGEEYEWRLLGTWEGESDAVLVRRSKVADRALTADASKSLTLSDATIVDLNPGIQGEVSYRSCGNDFWKIRIDCLVQFNSQIEKPICQFPASFPRNYLSERIHIKDPAYGKSLIADFAHIHKDSLGEMIVSFDRPIVGLVRCIGSWIL